MKKLLLGTAVWLLAGPVHAQTINILMESVPDTRFVQEVVPEFEEQTGIEVEIEVVNYAEMHTKLVPQLVAPTGSYDVIVVDFYWVGEFTKAGWLQPLDERIEANGFDTSVYFDSLMNLVGQVDGVTYMLPFYNYAMGLTYREDLVNDAQEQRAFKEKYGIELRVPETWDEYMKQVEFFTRDTDGDGQTDFYGVVNQGLRPDPIAMEWSNYLYANGGQYYEEDDWQPTLDTPEAANALRITAATSASMDRPVLRASASTRRSTSRPKARRTATSPTTCSAPPTTIPRSRRWSARWRSRRCRTAA
jgi:multiple sugar transport system substrate-binding protein